MRTKRSEPGGAHDLGHGLSVMWWKRVRIDDPDLEGIVELELRDDGDRLVVSKLTAEGRPGGPPVSADLLRAIPLARMAPEAIEGSLGGLVKVRSTGRKGSRITPGNLDALPMLERVAVIYRAALFLGQPPTTMVAETLDVTRDAAAKRVQAARSAGLLEPTSKGKKGA